MYNQSLFTLSDIHSLVPHWTRASVVQDRGSPASLLASPSVPRGPTRAQGTHLSGGGKSNSTPHDPEICISNSPPPQVILRHSQEWEL